MLAALLLVLMGALGFYIAYWISSTGLAYWRAVAGFAVAFMVSWVGGVGMSALVFAVTGTVNIGAATTSLLGKLFWWALICSGYGVYKGRAKFGPKVLADSDKLKNDAQPSVRAAAGNDSYAAALAEIEEGRLDKGVWARAFAEAGGEDAKAKALYIKARAGAAKNAVVWEDTQPPVANDNGIKTANAEQSAFKKPPPQNGPTSAIVAFSLVGVVVIGGILAVFVLPSHDDQTNRVRNGPDVARASQKSFSYEDAAGLSGAPKPAQAQRSQIDEFLDGAPKPAQAPASQAEWGENDPTVQIQPGYDSKGWTQETTGSSEVGPWLDYSPPGTRYCRYADRTIVRVYPPGVKPNAEKANPFCVGDSTEGVPR